MQNQLKFKIITGRGSEEKVEVKPEEKTKPLLQSTIAQPKANDAVTQKVPVPKKPFKVSKKTLKIILSFVIFIILSLGSYLIYKNAQSLSKNLQIFSFFSKFKRQKEAQPSEATSSESLLLLLQKFKSSQENTTTPTSTVTTSISTATQTQQEIMLPTQTTSTIDIGKQTTTPMQIATKTVSATPTQTTKIEKNEPASPKVEEIKTIKKEEIPPQKTKEAIIFPNLNSISVSLNELNEEGFKKAWLESLKIQKEAGSIYEVNFSFDGQKVINDLVVSYFIKPSFIETKHSEEFKKNLTEYKILFYYTYTRKFPILIFKVKDDSFVITFMRLWEKESLLKDMYNLYLGLPKGRLIRNFMITETYAGIKYNITYFDSDYKFIWTLYNNYLIFSTSLNAFKYVINLIK